MQIFDFLAVPLGRLMKFIYETASFQNYGLAIIIFTILTKAAMLPLTIKQFQSTARMQKLAPRLEELRRQYGTDKKTLNEETMKLYQEEQVNPAGGCLPLLITFPLMLSLYQVIIRPLRFLLDKTADQITAIVQLYRDISGSTVANIQEMEILNFFRRTPEAIDQAQAAGLLAPSELFDMSFLGFDLSSVPTYQPDKLFGPEMSTYLPLLLIPIIGVVFTYMSTKLHMAATAASQAAAAQNSPKASSMGKSMAYLGPAMTLFFSFQFPLGVLIYWNMGYIIQTVQQLFVNKYILRVGAFGNLAPPAEQGQGAIAAKPGAAGSIGAKSIGTAGTAARPPDEGARTQASGTSSDANAKRNGDGYGKGYGYGDGKGSVSGGGGGKGSGGGSSGKGGVISVSGGSGKGSGGGGKGKGKSHVGGGVLDRDISRYIAGSGGAVVAADGPDVGDGDGGGGGAYTDGAYTDGAYTDGVLANDMGSGGARANEARANGATGGASVAGASDAGAGAGAGADEVGAGAHEAGSDGYYSRNARPRASGAQSSARRNYGSSKRGSRRKK